MRLNKILDRLNHIKHFSESKLIKIQNNGIWVCETKYHVIRPNGYDDGYITVNVRFHPGYLANNLITTPQADNHNYRFGDWNAWFKNMLSDKLTEWNQQTANFMLVRKDKQAIVSIIHTDFCIQKKLDPKGPLYTMLIRTLPDMKKREELQNHNSSIFLRYDFFPRIKNRLYECNSRRIFGNLPMPTSNRDIVFLKNASAAKRVSAFPLGINDFGIPWNSQKTFIRI